MDIVAAITGGSAGIGKATAIRLARDGARVAICARTRERLEPVAAAIQDAGGRALAVPADVTNEKDMTAFVRRTIESFGRFDVMICNAGYGVAGSVDAVPQAQMRRVMDVNYFGTVNAVRAALDVFRPAGRGHVIIISSIVGRRGVPYMGAYAATKFAQVGLAESLRAEFAGSDIHVSLVFPVSTDTEFFDVMEHESGSPVTRSRGPSQSAETVADAIAGVIAHPVAEVYPYRKSRGLVWLNAIAPAYCDRMMKKFGRKPATAGVTR